MNMCSRIQACILIYCMFDPEVGSAIWLFELLLFYFGRKAVNGISLDRNYMKVVTHIIPLNIVMRMVSHYLLYQSFRCVCIVCISS